MKAVVAATAAATCIDAPFWRLTIAHSLSSEVMSRAFYETVSTGVAGTGRCAPKGSRGIDSMSQSWQDAAAAALAEMVSTRLTCP